MVKSVVNVNDIISNSVIDGVVDHAVGQLVRVKHTINRVYWPRYCGSAINAALCFLSRSYNRGLSGSKKGQLTQSQLQDVPNGLSNNRQCLYETLLYQFNKRNIAKQVSV